jgi:TonB family protein
MESTEIVFPTTPPPEIKIKVKLPPPPKVPNQHRNRGSPSWRRPRSTSPRSSPSRNSSRCRCRREMALPKIAAAKPQIVLAPQPKAALAAAAPALTPQQHPSVEAVHLGDMNGVKPNPNANQAGDSCGAGQSLWRRRARRKRPVAWLVPPDSGTAPSRARTQVRWARLPLPAFRAATARRRLWRLRESGKSGCGGNSCYGLSIFDPLRLRQEAKTTPPVLLSHAEPEYTEEARQLKIQGDVVLRVTITTTGEMVVHHVIHGLGHGLDESAMRSAPTYKFRPATQNGQPVNYTPTSSSNSRPLSVTAKAEPLETLQPQVLKAGEGGQSTTRDELNRGA